jgi:hypothetical protein
LLPSARRITVLGGFPFIASPESPYAQRHVAFFGSERSDLNRRRSFNDLAKPLEGDSHIVRHCLEVSVDVLGWLISS